MSKPIIVGYDPMTSDRAPINFGVAAARFTGAPLIIASASAAARPSRRRPAGRGARRRCLGRARTGQARARAGGDPGRVPRAGEHERRAGAARAERGRGRRPARRRLDPAGPVGRVIPGSTAERLMHGAPCPIAIVPPGWEAGAGLNTIGVAYVDTEEGREALRGAHALARRAGATLRVLTAVKAGLARYGETRGPDGRAARQGLRRGRGRAAGAAPRTRCGARPRRSTATSPSRPTPSSRIPPTSSSASPRTSTCSSAARAATVRCAPCCSAACRAA